jgi:hypothetical protein
MKASKIIPVNEVYRFPMTQGRSSFDQIACRIAQYTGFRA